MLWTFGEGRSNAGVNGTVLHGRESLNLPRSSYLQSVSFILGRVNASPSNTQGGSPVRESCTPGSVRGVLSNGHSYRDSRSFRCKQARHGLFGIPQRSNPALGHSFVSTPNAGTRFAASKKPSHFLVSVYICWIRHGLLS